VQRQHQDAERASLAARAVIEDLAEEIPDEAVRTSFLHQAVAWLPPSRRHTPERAAREAFGGLTAREREVAVLIARGQTNRQIAEALAITERTAERHVENIRGKLGFNSRLQIAVWAIEQGLSVVSRSVV
jgi:DNA-binding NarL/FixJ family response regulator